MKLSRFCDYHISRSLKHYLVRNAPFDQFRYGEQPSMINVHIDSPLPSNHLHFVPIICSDDDPKLLQKKSEWVDNVLRERVVK